MPNFIANNEPVLLWTGRAMLDGRATIPAQADAVVLIAGLGGTFHHERLRGIASRLNAEGFATLIADILTPDEQQFDARTGHFRVDVSFLAERLGGVLRWMHRSELTSNLPIGVFAMADTAAASIGAAEKNPLFALTLVNPRLDQIRPRLATMVVPALLLVQDTPSLVGLPQSVRVANVPSACALLDEDVVAEAVAHHATEWFRQQVPALV